MKILWILVLFSLLYRGDMIIQPDPVFAVITHKGGALKGMAHNHFILAEDPEVSFAFDPLEPEKTSFSLVTKSRLLKVDPHQQATASYPRLQALKVLDEAFEDVSESDRAKIRKAMLNKDQLNADQYPEIKAELLWLKPKKDQAADSGYQARMALTVVGQTVEKTVNATIVEVDGSWQIEALGAFKFTQFGIKPYSAFFGAVKNQDQFHVYVSFTAAPH